jgi:hypothetical protein
MKAMVWFIALAAVGGVVYGLYRVRAKWEERNKASEERFASFISQALPGSLPVAPAGAATAPTPAPMPLKANNDVVSSGCCSKPPRKRARRASPRSRFSSTPSS